MGYLAKAHTFHVRHLGIWDGVLGNVRETMGSSERELGSSLHTAISSPCFFGASSPSLSWDMEWFQWNKGGHHVVLRDGTWALEKCTFWMNSYPPQMGTRDFDHASKRVSKLVSSTHPADS